MRTLNNNSTLYNMRSLDYEEVKGPSLRPGLIYRSALPLFQEAPEMIRILQAQAANIKQLVAEVQQMGGATGYLQQEVGLTSQHMDQTRASLLTR